MVEHSALSSFDFKGGPIDGFFRLGSKTYLGPIHKGYELHNQMWDAPKPRHVHKVGPHAPHVPGIGARNFQNSQLFLTIHGAGNRAIKPNFYPNE